MFQSLRANNQFYILHKEGVPRVEVGTIVSVSVPMPKFQSTMPPFGQPQEMIVDVVARLQDGGNVSFQKLPATADIADFGANGQMVLATSKEAINAELGALRQRSYDIINSREFHLSVIEGCDKAYKDLNPEYAEKQQQAEEMSALKGQMSELSKSFNELVEMNKNLMAQLSDSLPKKSAATNKTKE